MPETHSGGDARDNMAMTQINAFRLMGTEFLVLMCQVLTSLVAQYLLLSNNTIQWRVKGVLHFQVARLHGRQRKLFK